MAKFLTEVRYNSEGAKGIAREGGSARRDAIAKFAEQAGGKLEAFYFAFGEVDAYVVIDFPDTVTAAAVALAVNQSGAVTAKNTLLITPEEMDAAAKKATQSTYRPPGS